MSETISSGLTLTIPTVGEQNWQQVMKDAMTAVSSHDHTGSGNGTQIGTGAIAADAVTTAKILDGNVTLAKLANVATDRLIGRDTAGTGVPEALTVGGGIEFTGSGGIQRSALTGDVTASAGSGITTIANDAVTTAKILNGAVTTTKVDFGWADWIPSITTGGTMTVSGVSSVVARYCQIGDIVMFTVKAVFTLGGTAYPYFTISLPVTAAATFAANAFPGQVGESQGGWVSAIAVPASSTTAIVRRMDGANWALGSTIMFLSGTYEAA